MQTENGLVFTAKKNTWFIGGKIDGLTENNILIEIKNRMYRLFKTLRNYEKVQIFSYM